MKNRLSEYDKLLDKLKKIVKDIKLTRKKLKAALDSLENYFDILGIIIVILDRNRKVHLLNRKGEEILGYKEDEILGEDWSKIVIPKGYKKQFNTLFTKLKQKKFIQVKYYEYPVITRNNKIKCISWCNTPLLDENKKVIGILSAGIDITEHIETENKLKKETQKWDNIFNNLNDGIIIINKRFVILEANMSAFKLACKNKKEIIGKYCYNVFHNLPHPHPDCPVVKLLKLKKFQTTENIVKTSDKILLASAIPLLDERKRIKNIIHIMKDITHYKYLENLLYESEKRFKTIVENVTDAIFIYQDKKIVFVNPKFEEIFGVKLKNIQAGEVNLFDLMPDESKRIIKRILNKCISGKDVQYKFEFKAYNKEKETIDIDVTLKSIKYNDKWAILGTLRDITSQKTMERHLFLSQRLDSIGRLAGGIAHDFNNILTSIINYAHIMERQLHPQDPLINDVRAIIKDADRATDLTRQLLAFGRRQIMQPQIININTIIKEMKEMLNRLIGEDIKIGMKLNHKLKQVNVDPSQMEQVILNLIINARDAMPKGGKIIIETDNVVLGEDYISTHQLVKPGNYVLLSISDTGKGIPENIKEKIFEPFFTTKEKGKGSGMGLATVYGIVKQSKGYIWVYSEPGKGTTFKIYLPVAKGRIKRPKKSRKWKSRLSKLKGNETILVVEDEHSVRRAIVRVLKSFGYNVIETSNGNEAVNFCKNYKKDIHLLITDVVMFGMDGKEVATTIKNYKKNIKILYMSGYTEDAIAHHRILEKNINFLQKPFTPSELIQKIREIFDAQ